MKITVWTAAGDDSNGTWARAFASESEAEDALLEAVGEDRESFAAWQALHAEEGLWEFLDEHKDDPSIDTYQLDEQEVELPPIRVLVALEGGCVQGAVADVEGVAVTVLDYDTEGADGHRIYSIPQREAFNADAYVAEYDADHDPAFIDAAKAADLSDPEEALEQLRLDVAGGFADAAEVEALEAQLPELLERKRQREEAERAKIEAIRAEHRAQREAQLTDA